MSTNKQALRERYSPQSAPKCDICGAEMTIQSMSASRVTYGCSGTIYDENGCHYADGRSLADDHYEQSRVTVTDESDPDVLALLDELEAAEKRIAELSVSHSKLHEGMAAIYNAICADGASTSLSAILTFVKRAFEESKAAAGITVKGE